jgi:hypothetical protein
MIIISIEQSSIVYTRSVHVVRFIAIVLLEPQFINQKYYNYRHLLGYKS